MTKPVISFLYFAPNCLNFDLLHYENWIAYLKLDKQAFVMTQNLDSYFTCSFGGKISKRCLFGLGMLIVNTCCVFGSATAQEKPNTPKFIICYNPMVPIEELEPYDLIVVDYAYPAKAIAALKRQGKTVFGYLSLGKVQKQRPFAVKVQDLGIACLEDKRYPDSLKVNVADRKWQELVVQSIVPGMKNMGFNGIFLDDLDDINSRNLRPHGVSLIHKIRQANPDLKLMANRGLEFLPQFAAHVDYSLLESCFLMDGQMRKPSDSQWALVLLAAAKRENPKLKGAAIDYISRTNQPLTPRQVQVIQEIRSLHVKSGLLSCVSTEDLQTVPRF